MHRLYLGFPVWKQVHEEYLGESRPPTPPTEVLDYPQNIAILTAQHWHTDSAARAQMLQVTGPPTSPRPTKQPFLGYAGFAMYRSRYYLAVRSWAISGFA
jgi:hypothetical protein